MVLKLNLIVDRNLNACNGFRLLEWLEKLWNIHSIPSKCDFRPSPPSIRWLLVLLFPPPPLPIAILYSRDLWIVCGRRCRGRVFMVSIRLTGLNRHSKGISCPLVGSMLENAVIFVAYNKIQSLFLPSESQRSLLSPAPLLPLSQLFLCGALSGSLCSFVLTPVELLKCRVQVRSLQVGLYNLNDSTTAVSPRPAARQIFSALWKGGILGMYRGHLWTFMRETGGSGMWFEIGRAHV